MTREERLAQLVTKWREECGRLRATGEACTHDHAPAPAAQPISAKPLRTSSRNSEKP
jgi:hypothetical protein